MSETIKYLILTLAAGFSLAVIGINILSAWLEKPDAKLKSENPMINELLDELESKNSKSLKAFKIVFITNIFFFIHFVYHLTGLLNAVE